MKESEDLKMMKNDSWKLEEAFQKSKFSSTRLQKIEGEFSVGKDKRNYWTPP